MPTQHRLRPEGLDALDAGVFVLESFATATRPMSLGEISARVELSKSRVYRILCTLKHHGLIEQSMRGGPYRLGSKLGVFASLTAAPSLPSVAAPVMAELSQELRGTVVLRVIEGNEQLTLDCVHSPEVLRTSYPVGARLPVYYGSSGKVLLAFRPVEEAEALLSKAGPLSGTSKAIIDSTEYRRELERVREIGFAVNLEETVLGVRGVASPVLDSDGRATAAIAVSFPVAALPQSRFADTGRRLRESARTIAGRLGYGAPGPAKLKREPVSVAAAKSQETRQRRKR